MRKTVFSKYFYAPPVQKQEKRYNRIISSLTLAIFLVAMPLLYGCSQNGEDSMDGVTLIPVRLTKDGKWGMINRSGKLVFEEEFREEPTVAYNGLFSVKEEKGYTVYRDSEDKPMPVDGLEGLSQVGFLEDGLLPIVSPGKRISIVNKEGKLKFELSPIKGEEIVKCAAGYAEGMLWIKTMEDKYGFYDKSGAVVIPAIYDVVCPFSEGLAVAGERDSTGSIKYKVIDKLGETVFKIKDDTYLNTFMFKYSYLVATKDRRGILINPKGDILKLPTKISRISDYNDKYLIFVNQEGDYGVADINGEVLIRAKYKYMWFHGQSQFFAQKSSDDKESILLDANGKEIKRYDFRNIVDKGPFGYIGWDGSTGQLLDKNLQPKSKEEFYMVGYEKAPAESVSSEYFNYDNVANHLFKLINGNKVGNYTLGETSAKVINGAPSEFYMKTEINLNLLDATGWKYMVRGIGLFTSYIVDYDYDYYSYARNYYWNPNSRLFGVELIVTCEEEWGDKGQNALEKCVKDNGFSLVKEGLLKSTHKKCAVYKKGEIMILISSLVDQNSGSFAVCDISIPYVKDHLLSSIISEENKANNAYDQNNTEENLSDTFNLEVATVESYSDWQ